MLDLAHRKFDEVSQSLHQVYAHIVFSTKDRKPTINGVSDHVHLLIRTNKNVANSEFMHQYGVAFDERYVWGRAFPPPIQGGEVVGC